MRIAVCAHAFPKLSETFVVDHVKALQRAGHEVQILAETLSGEPVVHPDAAAMRSLTHYLPVPSTAGVLVRRMLRTWHLRRYPEAPLEGVDLIHCHFGPVAKARLYLKHQLHVPFVTSFHGYDLGQYPRRHGPQVYDRLFREADTIVVNTRFARDRVAALGCPQEKIVLIPLGIDLSVFPFRTAQGPSDGGIVATVARLVPKKGIGVALQAMAGVLRSHRGWQYHIIGDGPLREELARQAADLGISHDVVFWGWQDRLATIAHLQAAQIFVLPSVMSANGDVETQGLVVQEAQALGLPVIVTAVGGLAEGVEAGASGFIVPPGDPTALADRLSFLMDHRGLWPEMGRRGRVLVEERYSLERYAAALDELYHRLAERRAA